MVNIIISKTDLDALSRVAKSEVGHFARYGNTQFKGALEAVVDTVINRVAHVGFRRSIQGVIDQRGQFSAINRLGTWTRLPRASSSIVGIITRHLIERSEGKSSIIKGALHFLNPYVSDSDPLAAWGNYVKAHPVAVFGSDRRHDVHYHGTDPRTRPQLPRDYSLKFRNLSHDFQGNGNSTTGSSDSSETPKFYYIDPEKAENVSLRMGVYPAELITILPARTKIQKIKENNNNSRWWLIETSINEQFVISGYMSSKFLSPIENGDSRGILEQESGGNYNEIYSSIIVGEPNDNTDFQALSSGTEEPEGNTETSNRMLDVNKNNQHRLFEKMARSLSSHNKDHQENNHDENDIAEFEDIDSHNIPDLSDFGKNIDKDVDTLSRLFRDTDIQGFNYNEFSEFIAGLGLEYFQPVEFLVLGASNNSGGRCAGLNHLPPKQTWPDLANTAKMLDKIRSELGAPIRILSGFRSNQYNNCIRGSSRSLHKKFNALDWTCTQGRTSEWRDVARNIRSNNNDYKGGIGYYPRSRFIHTDTRGYNVDW